MNSYILKTILIQLEKNYNSEIYSTSPSLLPNFMPFKLPFGSSDITVTGKSVFGDMNILWVTSWRVVMLIIYVSSSFVKSPSKKTSLKVWLKRWGGKSPSILKWSSKSLKIITVSYVPNLKKIFPSN